MTILKSWLQLPEPESFPLAEVISAIRSSGKHFVEDELVADLALARQRLPAEAEALHRVLSTLLDKHDGRFDNPSYLALHDLPLPGPTGRCPFDTSVALQRRDRLIMLLVADLLRFEINAHEGATDFLPLMRPDAKTLAKRCALGLRLLRSTIDSCGIDATFDAGCPVKTARELCNRAELEQTIDERRMLLVTMLPVYSAHDEYLFIRMLQCYEVTFALVVTHLRAAIAAAHISDASLVASALRDATTAMDRATPLFSLVATMQVAAFMAFREFTDGASAIQSRNYKTIESLCRRPDQDRLFGPGYDATPEVRECVIAGQRSLQEAIAVGLFGSGEMEILQLEMQSFQNEILACRRTHYSIATKLLGIKRGTGHTEGVPYLAAAQNIPLFKCPFAHLDSAGR